MGKFASRAGEKLQFALDIFKIPPKDLVVADFGSSTGGFVDVLLKNGAKKVFSVDTAYGELDWKLRNDKSVVVLERTNAMHVRLPQKVDLITIDVGWTKQRKIIPNAFRNLKKEGRIITLIKPHYEAQKDSLIKGKLQSKKLEEVLEKVKGDVESEGGKIEKIVKSPLRGARAANVEFLALISCFN